MEPDFICRDRIAIRDPVELSIWPSYGSVVRGAKATKLIVGMAAVNDGRPNPRSPFRVEPDEAVERLVLAIDADVHHVALTPRQVSQLIDILAPYAEGFPDANR